jgi:hypothetical protein
LEAAVEAYLAEVRWFDKQARYRRWSIISMVSIVVSLLMMIALILLLPGAWGAVAIVLPVALAAVWLWLIDEKLADASLKGRHQTQADKALIEMERWSAPLYSESLRIEQEFNAAMLAKRGKTYFDVSPWGGGDTETP